MDAGHRLVPHTADLALEAWAPTRGECIAEAARALVESFADVRGAVPGQTVALTAEAPTDEDLLVRVLDEVIYQLEVHGLVPVDISVTGPGEGPVTEGPAGQDAVREAEVRFAAAPVAGTEVTGAIPKAVTLHELSFTRTGGQWRCHVTVDI